MIVPYRSLLKPFGFACLVSFYRKIKGPCRHDQSRPVAVHGIMKSHQVSAGVHALSIGFDIEGSASVQELA